MRITEPYTIFLRTLPSGKKVYYYQFRTEDGRRSPIYSCGTSKHSEAVRLCNRLYNEGKFKTDDSMTFGIFAKDFFADDSEFCKWKKVNGKPLAPETQRQYISLLEHQIMPYFEKLKLNKINTNTVKKWIVWSSERCSAKTSNSAQSVLNIILKSAREKKLISENPCENLTFRKVNKKERVLLTVKELNAIYHSNEWNYEVVRNAFLVTAITGMRIGEVTGLQTCDVGDDRLDVKHSLNPKFGLGATKTRVNRFVPIPKSLNLKSKCGKKWAFTNPNTGEPITGNYVYVRLINICKSLGIDTKARGITVHSLRNTFISYMRGSSFGETIDLKIKAVVGHSDKTVTDWYTYWTPEMFPEIYEIQEKLYREITQGENYEN